MLGNSHFYNRTIRKIVVAMGTVLNDIDIVRYTKDGLTAKEKFRVPLSYGAKEKYITRRRNRFMLILYLFSLFFLIYL